MWINSISISKIQNDKLALFTETHPTIHFLALVYMLDILKDCNQPLFFRNTICNAHFAKTFLLKQKLQRNNNYFEIFFSFLNLLCGLSFGGWLLRHDLGFRQRSQILFILLLVKQNDVSFGSRLPRQERRTSSMCLFVVLFRDWIGTTELFKCLGMPWYTKTE